MQAEALLHPASGQSPQWAVGPMEEDLISPRILDFGFI
jgi:hypothetical protein